MTFTAKQLQLEVQSKEKRQEYVCDVKGREGKEIILCVRVTIEKLDSDSSQGGSPQWKMVV